MKYLLECIEIIIGIIIMTSPWFIDFFTVKEGIFFGFILVLLGIASIFIERGDK